MSSNQNKYIQQMRKEYPEYSHVNDIDLAKAYREKHYASRDEDEFINTIGLHQPTLTERVSKSVRDTLEPLLPSSTPPSAAQQHSNIDVVPIQTAIAPEKTFRQKATETIGDMFPSSTPPSAAQQHANDSQVTDYVNPESGEWESGKLFVNAINKITANTIQGAYAVAGNIKSPLDMIYETDAAKQVNDDRSQWFKKASDNINDYVYEQNKMDVKPTHTWEETKKAFATGGVFDKDAWQELANATLSTGVESVPEMAAMVVNMPLYYASKQQENAEQRAKNQNRPAPILEDYVMTMYSTMGSVMLDRFGLKGMTSDVVENVGKQAIDGSLKDVAMTITKEAKQGGVKEAATEFIQNPLEMYGQEVGTAKGLSSAEKYLDVGIEGAVLAGGMGAGMSGTVATGTEVVNKYTQDKREAQRDAYRQDAYNRQMMGGALEMQLSQAPIDAYTQEVDAKINTIQSALTNLAINHPEHSIPVEAMDNIDVAEQVINEATAQGMNITDNNGMNAIDTGFAQVAQEMGVDLTPVIEAQAPVIGDTITPVANTVQEPIEQTQPIIENPIIGQPEPEAVVQDSLTTQPINTDRLKELEAIPDDELTVEQQWELEDLRKPTEENFTGENVDPVVKDNLIGDVNDMNVAEIGGNDVSVATKENSTNDNTPPLLIGQNDYEVQPITRDATLGYLIKVAKDRGAKGTEIKKQAQEFLSTIGFDKITGLATGYKSPNNADVTDMNVGDIAQTNTQSLSKEQTASVEAIKSKYIAKRIKEDNAYTQELKDKYGEDSEQYKRRIAQYADDSALHTGYTEHFNRNFDEMLNAFDNGNMDIIHSRIVNGMGFDQYKRAIEAVRDINFGKTNKSTVEAVDKFFGGKYNTFLQEREAVRLEEAKKKHVASLINLLDSQTIRYKQESMSRKEFLDKIFADGYTNIESKKRGAVNRYSLSNGESSFELDKNQVEYVNMLIESKIQQEMDAEEKDKQKNPDKYLSDEEANHLFNRNGDTIQQQGVDNGNINSGAKEPIPEQLQGDAGATPESLGTQTDVTREEPNPVPTIEVATDVGGDGTVSSTGVQPDRSAGDGDKRPSTNGRVDTQNQYTLTQDDVYASGEVGRFVANIDAIKLLKQNKQHYTKEEKLTLSKYTGFGGLGKAFRDLNGQAVEGWSERVRMLEGLLTPDELKNVKSGQLDAYYTPIKIAQSMWDISAHLGFKGGTVLEPSMGVGRFVGLLPQNLKGKVAFNGIEIDPTTYKIAAALYGNINARNMGFEETNYDSAHDMVIGNPPYGEFKLYDKNKKEYNTLSAHNYFVVKSLDALKEGGVLNFVISSSFLDNLDAKTIALINAKANFIGAIRLPSDAFKETGTKVTTDIVIFQKKIDPKIENPKAWSTKGSLNGFKINQYFIDNPQMLLGDWVKGYRGGELKANGDFEAKLSDAIASLPKDILASDGTIQENKKHHAYRPSVMYIEGESVFVNIKDGEGVTQKKINLTPAKAKQFIALRDELLTLVDMQLNTTLNDKEVEAQRTKVNALYDGWVKKNGALNKTLTRSAITKDKDGFLVATLEENYKGEIKADNKSGKEPRAESWEKADILTTRTIRPQTDIKATNAKEALEFAINQKGNVDLEYMAQISDKNQEELADELLGDIFYDGDAGWVTKDEFLSGDVKTKLQNATDDFHKEALLEVIPQDLEAQDIRVEIGQSWIDAKYIAKFMGEELGYKNQKAHQSSATAKWFVGGSSYNFPFTASGVENNAILDSALNNKIVRVTFKDKSGKTYLDEERTDFANSQVQMLKEKFEGWVFADATRRDELVAYYNETKNRFVEKNVEDIIEKYSIPNIKHFSPRVHQTRAVYKTVFGASPMLLNHTVGSGKTLTSQMVAMEWRRLGKAKKPLIVTLKSVVPQYVREFRMAYPNAKILLPNDSDFSTANRKMLLSSIATGDYDAVVLSHEQLSALQNPLELQNELVLDEIENLEAALREVLDSDLDYKEKGRSKRQIELAIEKLETNLAKLQDASKDDVLGFDKLGIDGIIVDEAHYFKKLVYSTSMGSIKGMPDTSGSKRAFDLYVKTQYLLRNNPHKTVVFMTGTPITNTLPELYLLQKYLQADELKAQGIYHFDAWAKDYTEQTTEIELTSTGGLKEVTRLKEFKNLPTLIQTTRQFVDTVTNNDIKKSDVNFKLPPLKNGKVTEVYAQPSESQVKFNLELIKRIEAFGKDNPDNHLAVFGDGAKMAIDMRLISSSFQDTPDSKVNLAVAKVFEKYQEFDSVKGTQLIFSDKGVPKGKDTKAKLEELIRQADEGNEEAQKALNEYNDEEIDDVLNGSFSVYSDMKSKLVKLGIPENEVVFIHDFDTKEKKEKLSELVNSGAIRIVIGSTKKLGTGMNVQKRLTAVHHIDIPFTPAELEQRNGRIIRQGNELLKTIEGFEVEIVHYLTKRTLDAMNFQILQNKAKFIEQFYNGSMDGDVDIDEMSNSELAERIKAEASGNPLLIDKMRLEKQLQKLRRIARGQELANQQRVYKIAQEEKWLKTIEANIPKVEKDAQEIENNKVIINGKVVETRKEIGEALYDEVSKLKESRAINPKEIGEIGSIKIEIQYSVTTDGVKINFKSLYPNALDYTYTGQSIEGLGTKFVNRMNFYSEQLAYYTNQLPVTKEVLASLKNSKEGTFDKQDELEAMEQELKAVKKGIADAANPEKKATTKEEEEKAPTESYMKITPNVQTKEDSINQHYSRAQGYDVAGVNFVAPYSVIGLPSRSSDDFITIGNDRVALPSTEKPMNADTLRVYVSDIIGSRLYDGRIKGNKNVGVYKHKDSSIRLKSFSDMEVLAHEMAHYLDYFHKNSKKNAAGSFFRQAILNNKEEVKSLSYTTNPDDVISEGFAEFVRLYLTNYNTVAQLAPNMMKDFEARLNDDQELAKKMVTLRDGMHQYFYQGATTRNYQGGELSPTAQKIQRSQAQIGKDYRQKLIDRIHSIKRIEAEIRGDNAADAMNSPYKALQLVNGHSSIMHTAMNFGVPAVAANGDISYSGKSLNDIFAPATSVSEERVRLLSDYLVARRANELREQGRENLIPQEAIDNDLKYTQQYPEFETIAKEYQEFNTAMLDFYVGMNHITEAQRESFLEFNQNYVPFHRVMDSVQNGKTVQMSTIGKRLTGGTHSLGNIMENIIDGLESNIKEALISRGKSMFYDMLDQSGMGGVYATKVSTESEAFKADLFAQASAVARTMQDLGLSVSKDGMISVGSLQQNDVFDIEEITQILSDRPELLTFFSHGHPPVAGSDSYIDSAIINGVRVYFETKDAGLIEAMTSFKGQSYGMAMNALMNVKNVMTWNITNNPLFYLTNFARDTVSASVLSKNGFIPVLTSMKGMYHFVTQSKVYKDFMASGAGYGTMRTTSGRDIQSMRMLNVNRGLDVFNKIISGMAYGADMFEYGTRVGEFELAQKAGKSNWQSAFEAREISTDFAIKGANSNFTGFMATVPFMKAAVNGIDKTARRIFSLNGEMKLSNIVKFHNAQGELQKHKVKLYATGGIIMAATLALWFQNKDDDRYKKLTRDQKLMYWNIFVGDKHIKIPRPYDIGFVFAALPEIIADGIFTKHGKDAAMDFLWGVKSMFLIGDISGLFQPIADHMTNTNWMGSPIIPSNMQNMDDKGDQYNERTALIYKNAGKATGISPIMMQHYIDGYLGLTAKMIEETTENLLWDTKAWGARPFAQNPIEFLTYRFMGKKEDSRTAWSEKYYELSNKADGVKKSYDMKYKKAYIDGGKDVTKYASEKETQAYLAIDEITGDINSQLADMKVSLEQVTYSNKYTRDQKEKIINDAYKNKRVALEGVVKQLDTALKTLEGEK